MELLGMNFAQAAAELYDGGWRARDGEELKTVYKLTEGETDRICEELGKLEKEHHTFDSLKPDMQWELISEFCCDQALYYLYPEESLGDLLKTWDVNMEDAFYLGSKNGFLIRFTDNVFIGDAEKETITSFRNWDEYKLRKFYPEVLDEFKEWMAKNYPEMGVEF